MHYMQVLKTKLLLLLSFQPHSHDLYYTMDAALYNNACTLQRTSRIVYSLIVFYCTSCMVLVSSVGVVSVSENIKTKLEKIKATAHNYRLKWTCTHTHRLSIIHVHECLILCKVALSEYIIINRGGEIPSIHTQTLHCNTKGQPRFN